MTPLPQDHYPQIKLSATKIKDYARRIRYCTNCVDKIIVITIATFFVINILSAYMIDNCCTKSGKQPLLYYSSFVCVLHFNVVFCFVKVLLLYLMRFPQFQFVSLICFFPNQFMNFEQPYITVVFIAYKPSYDSGEFSSFLNTKQQTTHQVKRKILQL